MPTRRPLPSSQPSHRPVPSRPYPSPVRVQPLSFRHLPPRIPPATSMRPRTVITLTVDELNIAIDNIFRELAALRREQMECGVSRESGTEKWNRLEEEIRELEERKGAFQDKLFEPWGARWD